MDWIYWDLKLRGIIFYFKKIQYHLYKYLAKKKKYLKKKKEKKSWTWKQVWRSPWLGIPCDGKEREQIYIGKTENDIMCQLINTVSNSKQQPEK